MPDKDLFAQAELVRQARVLAQKYNVPPELVIGVMQQESQINPAAVSPAGAQGLMQLMPETAKGLGVTNSFDPAQNMEGGVKYLSQLLKQFHGDQTLALAAYNSGPGRVASLGRVPHIPETEDYVKKITSNIQRMQNNPAPVPGSTGQATVLQQSGPSTYQEPPATPAAAPPQRDLFAEAEALRMQRSMAPSHTQAATLPGHALTSWLPMAGGTVGGLLGAAGGTAFGFGFGGIPGAVGGATLGAGAGEAGRELIDRFVYGQPQVNTSMDAAKAIGTEGAISGASELVAGGLGKFVKGAAAKAYIKVMKPSEKATKATNAFRATGSKVAAERELAETAIQNGLGPNERSFTKVGKKITNLNDAVQAMLDNSGQRVRKNEILAPVRDMLLPSHLATEANPSAVTSSAQNVIKELMEHPSYTKTIPGPTLPGSSSPANFAAGRLSATHTPPMKLPDTILHRKIPLGDVNRLKSSAYSKVMGGWGRDAAESAADDAWKAYARGAKEAVSARVPGVNGMLEEESRLIPVSQMVNDAGKRIANSNLISANDLWALAAAGSIGGGAFGMGADGKQATGIPASLALAYSLLRRPAIAAPLARGAWKTGAKIPATGSGLARLFFSGEDQSSD